MMRVLLLAVGASGFFEGMKRQGLVKKAESLALEKYGAGVSWLDGESVLACSEPFWRWVAREQDTPDNLLGLSRLGGPEARKLAGLTDNVESLSLVEGVGCLRLLKTAEKEAGGSVGSATTRLRLEAFVERVLVGLRQCPFTASAQMAGVGLEELGVQGAPILYAHSDATTRAGLMADTWQILNEFLDKGEKGYSSILLAAPHWDGGDKWTEWYEEIFPLLESSVLAAQLGRKVGIVCFHDAYSTPEPQWLARHRFGHQYAPPTLRRWAQEVDPEFEATVTDSELQEFGSYMRRTPHACINVLWSRQLEAAETKRESRQLYVRNLKRLMEQGTDALEAAHETEKNQ